MRRIILVTFILLASIASPIYAQEKIRTADPIIHTVEVGSPEPLPAGVSGSILLFAPGGAGGPPPYTSKRPQWFFVPHLLEQQGILIACGYVNSTPPTALLHLPSGREVSLPAEDYTYLSFDELAGYGRVGQLPMSPGDGCYKYVVEWELGMELGVYTLVLSHEAGDLSYTWGMDYPYCQKRITVERTTRRIRDYQMGFSPNTDYIVDFYAQLTTSPSQDSVPFAFIARRVVTTDKEGAFLLDIKLARSAPYTFDTAFQTDQGEDWTRFIYAISDTNGRRLDWTHVPQSVGVMLPDEGLDGTNLIDEPDTRPCAGYFGRFVQVANADGLSPYMGFEGTQQTSTPFANGTVLEIFERRVSVATGRTEIWSHVRSANTQEGWLVGIEGLAPVDLTSTEEQNVYVVQGDDGGYVLPSWLEDGVALDSVAMVDENNAPLMFLLLGTRVELVDGAGFDGDLRVGHLVRYNGVTGYMRWVVPLPWAASAPVEQTAKNIPPLVETPEWVTINLDGENTAPTEAPATTTIDCPDTPPTQFKVGMRGTVLPFADGTARPVNVRDLPVRNGNLVIKMGANTLFTIIDGPSCADGYLWWKIQIDNGPTGWVAEGSMENYFIDPVQ
jgi:hypothetical protein